MEMGFERSVFINCPFDAAYVPLLRANIFTLLCLGFEPKLAQTTSSAITRIQQISRLIPQCLYSIHDLSRMNATRKNELPRFNMPYELGLDQGCITYGQGKLQRKMMLVLASDKYMYRKVLSDISGQDIEAHENKPTLMVEIVRNWFSRLDDRRRYATGQEIFIDFSLFSDYLKKLFLSSGHSEADVEKIQVSDYINL